MILEVSNNSLSTYRTCNKKWYWNYVEGLKPRQQVSALTLGSTIHEAFDRHYKGQTQQDIMNWIDKSYKEQIAKAPLEEQEQLYIDQKTCQGMFSNFPFKVMTFEKIESEVEFRVRLCHGIYFRGRIDGKVQLAGRKWIRELKTSGETGTMFENRAAVSGQATGYVWATIEETGDDIVGVLYDYIRKPRLEKRVTEDMYRYAQRVYDDYCDLTKHKSYFRRYRTYRTPVDIAFWKQDTMQTAKHIRKCVHTGEFPRNTGSCFVFNRECAYKRICMEVKPDPMIIEMFYDKRESVLDAQPKAQSKSAHVKYHREEERKWQKQK